MKNKFFLCFRPVVIETEESDHHNHVISDDEVSKDIIVAKAQKKKNGIMPPAMSPSLFDGNSGNLPKTHSRKTISRVLKTILYETSPRMMIQNGKNGQITIPEKTNDRAKGSNSPLEKVDADKRVNEADISEENKIISSISSSASCSSSTVSSASDQPSKDFRSLSMKRTLARSRSNSFDQKKRAKTIKINDKTFDFPSASSSKDKEDSVFYWIVLNLLATILWGKIFGIILASLWLYFITCRSGMEQRVPENKAVKLPEMETSNSKEYEEKNHNGRHA